MASRSPSWGAWIEIYNLWKAVIIKWQVAPPRGERGLKSLFHFLFFLSKRSLPLVGSVD